MLRARFFLLKRNENLTALLLCAVSGFEIYYTKGVRFLFKIHSPHNPPQMSPEKTVDWLISKLLLPLPLPLPPLAAFHILFYLISSRVHRENPKTAPTNASNNTWCLNNFTLAVEWTAQKMIIRHAVNGFWLSLGTRCAIMGMEEFESVIKINITIKSEHSKRWEKNSRIVSGNCQNPRRLV